LNNLEAFMTLKSALELPTARLPLAHRAAGDTDRVTGLSAPSPIVSGLKEVYLQRMVYWHDDNNEKLATADQSLFQSLQVNEEEIIQASEALAKQIGLRFEASGATTPTQSIHHAADTRPWARCMRPGR